MKKLIFLLLFVTCGMYAQDLDSLRTDYIKCNKGGKMISQIDIELFYASDYVLSTPYMLFAYKGLNGVFTYKVLIDPNAENKDLIIKEAFDSIIGNEILEYEVRI